MQREQPSSDETGSPASSTENAKDMSNSTDMPLSRGHADDSNKRSCSEKDSGYSDASSDCKHTNAKDRSNRKSRETTDELPLNQSEPHGSHGNAIVAPSTGQLPSFIIIKNMVLEQPQKNGQLLWSSQASPHDPSSNPVLLLQPPNVLPPALQPRAPGLCQSNATGKTDGAAYLPILNSYPRIAPHPNKKPPDKTAPTSESLNLSKRMCIESNNTQADRSPQEQPGDKICAGNSATFFNSASGSTTRPTTRPTSSTEPNKTSVINTRHRRLINTMQTLKQSGVLDAALRTKELMRQSSVTGREVAQLRQHSDLLCQVASSSNQNPSNMAAFLNLHKLMADSGRYPDLENVQALKVPTTCQNVSVIKPQSVNVAGDSDGSPGISNNSESASKQMDRSRDKSETLVDKDTSESQVKILL